MVYDGFSCGKIDGILGIYKKAQFPVVIEVLKFCQIGSHCVTLRDKDIYLRLQGVWLFFVFFCKCSWLLFLGAHLSLIFGRPIHFYQTVGDSCWQDSLRRHLHQNRGFLFSFLSCFLFFVRHETRGVAYASMPPNLPRAKIGPFFARAVLFQTLIPGWVPVKCFIFGPKCC